MCSEKNTMCTYNKPCFETFDASDKKRINLSNYNLSNHSEARFARWYVLISYQLNTSFGIFWKALEWKIRVYFRPCSIFYVQLLYFVVIFTVLVFCTKKNLAILSEELDSYSWLTSSTTRPKYAYIAT
jgi:hypothetical protein